MESMENDFKHFMTCLKEAGKRMIDGHYFQIYVDGLEKPIYRERVYCYELYHQLRCVLGDNFSYKLDGELDKAGHPIIRPKLGPKKPDFVVHVPRDMDQNLVVIEVKPVTVKDRLGELEKDLETLKGFLNKKAKYHRAIMLVYGDGGQDLPQKIQDLVESFSDERILLVWHRGPREKPKVV